MNVQRDLKKEIDTWQSNVKNGFPFVSEFFVLCSWVEVFSVPFKLTAHKIYTYLQNTNTYLRYNVLRIRPEFQGELTKQLNAANVLSQEVNVSASFWRTVGNYLKALVGNYRHNSVKEIIFKIDPLLESNQNISILKNFPEFLQFENRFKSKLKYGAEISLFNYKGVLTGRYYFDYYGYLWLEVVPFFIPGKINITGWVRETAIFYKEKNNAQQWIEDNRPKEPKKNGSKNILLVAASLFLALKG